MKLRNLVLASGLAALASCQEPKVATIEYNIGQVKVKFECHKTANGVDVYEDYRMGMNFISSYDIQTKEIKISHRVLNGGFYANPSAVIYNITSLTNDCVDKLNSQK